MAPAIAKPLLSDLVAQSGRVPSSHIRPVGDRPDLANVDRESGAGIPLIDLKQLDGPERHKVVEAIGSACETDGSFMVTNHGIPEAVVDGMPRVAREFFHLPESERRGSNWRDFLRLRCYPLESFIDQWTSNPPTFRIPPSGGYEQLVEPMIALGIGFEGPSTPAAESSSVDTALNSVLFLDSGASCHMVSHAALLRNPRDPPAGMDLVRTADGSHLPVVAYGDIQMEGYDIRDVCLVRGLKVNLISVGQLASSHNICSSFLGDQCNLMLADGSIIGGAFRRKDNQYILRFLEIP